MQSYPNNVTYNPEFLRARSALEEELIPTFIGLWFVHFLFFIIAILLLYSPSMRLWIKQNTPLVGR